MFEGAVAGKPYDGLPKVWKAVVPARLEGVTPHVLRHSFASTANGLGYTEATIAALLGHASGSVTNRYVHVLDAHLVAAADAVSAHIADLLEVSAFPPHFDPRLFEQWATICTRLGIAAE